jgi:hypothetical protein
MESTLFTGAGAPEGSSINENMPMVAAQAPKGSTLMAAQAETAVYLQGDYIVISQPDPGDPDGRDDIVTIAVENVELLRLRLEELERQARSQAG